MDGEDFLDRLRANHDTELSRLGSSKALYALTGGEMDTETVHAAAAADAEYAEDVCSSMAGRTDDAVQERFEAAAETAVEQRERFGPVEESEVGESPPMYATLGGLEGDPERVGGLVARYVVVEAYAGQFVGFFVGNADPNTASEFRDLRAEYEDEREATVELLESVCENDDDWDRATAGASGVIGAAYDDYVETLEGMGVEPKNVC